MNKKQKKTSEKQEAVPRVIYPNVSSYATWALNGWSEACYSASHERTHPYHSYNSDGWREGDRDDFEEFLRTKNVKTYCVSTHIYRKGVSDVLNDTVEYVIRIPNDTQDVSTGEADYGNFPFYEAKRFASKQYNPKMCTVKTTARDDVTLYHAQFINDDPVSYDTDVIMTYDITAIGEGIRSITINDTYVHNLAEDGTTKIVSGNLTIFQFVELMKNFSMSPADIFGDVEATVDKVVDVYIHLAKGDETVQLHSGSLAPTVVKVNTLATNYANDGSLFESYSNYLNKHLKLSDVNIDEMHPRVVESMTYGAAKLKSARNIVEPIMEPTVHPAFMGSLTDYKQLNYDKFVSDNVKNDKMDVNLYNEKGELITKKKLFSLDLEVSPGRRASPMHTTSSLAWDKCGACGFKTWKGYAHVDEDDYTNGHGHTFKSAMDYGYADITKVESKFAAIVEVSAAYLDGMLVDPANITIIDNVSGTTVSEIQVMSPDEFQEDSSAEQMNKIWTTYLATISFAASDKAIFRAVMNRANEAVEGLLDTGVNALLEQIKLDDEYVKFLHNTEVTNEEKLKSLKDEDNQRSFARFISFMSYLIAGMSFARLMTAIDYEDANWDNVDETLVGLFRDGIVENMKDSFVENYIASSLAEHCAKAMRTYIDLEGYKFFPVSGTIHSADELGSQGSTITTAPTQLQTFLKILGGPVSFVASLVTPILWLAQKTFTILVNVITATRNKTRNCYNRMFRLSKDRWYLFALDVEKGFNDQNLTKDIEPTNNLAWASYDKEYRFSETDSMSHHLDKDGHVWLDSIDMTDNVYLRDIRHRNLIVSWLTGVNPEYTDLLMSHLAKFPKTSCKGLMNLLMSTHIDIGLEANKDESVNNLFMYKDIPLEWEFIDNLSNHPAHVLIGKYKILHYDFAPLLDPRNNENYPEDAEYQLRELIGFQYDVDIGITADPKCVESYGNWIDQSNVGSIINDTWDFTTQFVETIRSFHEEKMDKLRSSYFATVESYIQKNLMSKLDADDSGNKTLNMGTKVVEADVIDVSMATMSDEQAASIVNYANSFNITQGHGLKTARFIYNRNKSAEFKSIMNCAYMPNKPRFIGAAIMAGIGAAVAVTAGVFAAMLITKKQAAVKKMKATLNVTLGTKMKDIRESYDVVNSVIEDNLFIYDSKMTVQKTQSTQVYGWCGDDFTVDEIARLGAFTAMAIAGVAICAKNAVKATNQRKLSKRAPDGSLTEKEKKRQQDKLAKKNAKKLNKKAGAFTKKVENVKNKADAELAASRKKNDAYNKLSILNKPGVTQAEKDKAVADYKLALNEHSNASRELAKAELQATKAGKKFNNTASKNEAKTAKLNSRLSNNLSQGKMNKIEAKASPDKNVPLEMVDAMRSKATFKAITELADTTDDLFSRLMESYSLAVASDDKLDKIFKRVKNLGNSSNGFYHSLGRIDKD